MRVGGIKKTTERGKVSCLGPPALSVVDCTQTGAVSPLGPKLTKNLGANLQVSFRHRANPIFDERLELVLDGSLTRQPDLAIHVEVRCCWCCRKQLCPCGAAAV